MSKHYFVIPTFACLLFSVQVWAQGAPFVLVSDLSGHQILNVNTSTGAVTPIFTLANSNLEGIVYGPEGTGSVGNKVYLCDPTADKIYRLNLTITSGQATAAISDGTVYDGANASGPPAKQLHHAQCGRFTSTGDFLVSSKTSGGVWKFGASSLSSIPATPAQIISGTDAEGDITQANNGDLLILDPTIKSVLKSTDFTSASPFITENLTQPTNGIARRNDGKIYVADGGGQNNIKVFTADGNPDSLNSVCGSFGDTPEFIKVAADGTLYVVTSHFTGSGLNNGKLWRVDTSTCVTTLVADIGQSGNPPAFGVAIPPTSVSKTKPAFTGSQDFNFGFSQFVASNVASCTGPVTVTESQTHLSDLQTLSPAGTSPVPFLGEAGFGTQFAFPHGVCSPQGTLLDFALAGFIFTNGVNTNPRVVECADGATNSSGCDVGLDGFFPVSEAIPGDCCIIKKPGTGSTFFVVTQPLDNSVLGQFCGFQNPLNNSLTNNPNPLAPGVAVVTGNTLAIKFTIAKGTPVKCTSTKTADFITNALELLSLIRVRDAQGNVTNDIVTPLSSTSTYINPCAGMPGSPICVERGNKQYSFSLSTQGLQPGVWNLSLTSLTNNINVQWNYFRIP